MPVKKREKLDPEQANLWEKILILAQRVDKLEFTLMDLRTDFKTFSENELKELKATQTTLIRDETYRKHDWLKAGLTIAAAVILVGFLIWFSLVTQVHNLDVIVKQQIQWTPHFVTKDQLQNTVNEYLEKIRKEIKEQNAIKPLEVPK